MVVSAQRRRESRRGPCFRQFEITVCHKPSDKEDSLDCKDLSINEDKPRSNQLGNRSHGSILSTKVIHEITMNPVHSGAMSINASESSMISIIRLSSNP